MWSKKDIELNKDFHVWWDDMGYHYQPLNEEEADWLIVVKWWAWKSYQKGRTENN